MLQTLRPAEIILIEDYSEDDTLKVLQVLQQQHGPEWIKIIAMTENRGPSVARNLGWDTAKHPYIAFLDSDDTWHPQKLEIQYAFMERNPEVVLVGGLVQVIKPGNPNSPPMNTLSPCFFRVTKWAALLKNQFITPTVMLRRSLFFRFNEKKRRSEDLLLWLSICLSGNTCYRIDTPLAFLHKASYGQSGLSGNIWAMQIGELDAYWKIYKNGWLNKASFIIVACFSLLKFVKRWLTVKFRG